MLLIETILRRWYAFAFLGLFFWAASAERGWKRALRFFAVAAVIEFLAEYLSTHWGFPFGRYDYTGFTRGDELYVSNIPLFVPVTFCVVVWAGRSLAQVGMRARRPGALIVFGAVTAAALDLIIDPMTLRGNSWFLGRLYTFEADGPWFGVPWSNLGGWVLVSAVVLWVDELFEVGRERVVEPLRGPTLAAVIAGFFLLLALGTRHWGVFFGQLGITGIMWAASAANVRAAIAAARAGPAPA